MRNAGLYERGGTVFVFSEHETTAGLHIQQDDAVAVSMLDFEGIGEAVRTALAAYRVGVAHPDFANFKPLDTHKRLLSLAGVRSLRAFYASARMVSVKDDNGYLILEPWQAEGKTSEYAPVDGKARLLASTATSREVGEAVVAALGDAVAP